MRPQHLEDLAAPPPLGYRPIRGPEVAHRLRPLPLGRLRPNKRIRVRLARRYGRVRRRVRVRGLALRRPVVYVPVVLIEQRVVLRQEAARHAGQMGLCKRREEEV